MSSNAVKFRRVATKLSRHPNQRQHVIKVSSKICAVINLTIACHDVNYGIDDERILLYNEKDFHENTLVEFDTMDFVRNLIQVPSGIVSTSVCRGATERRHKKDEV